MRRPRRWSIWTGVLAIVGGVVFVIGDATDSTVGLPGTPR
jgi:drug/metabolite transporter (DMT)-like permease